MNIGQRIGALMKRRGWTVQELERRSGLKEGYLYKLLAGRFENPTGRTLARLAHAFEMGVDELLRDESTDVPTSGANVPGQTPATFDSIQALSEQMQALDQRLHNAMAQLQEVVMVPHLGSVPAGTPLPPLEAAVLHIPIPMRRLAGIKRPAAITVSGDSMVPTLQPGWELVLETDPDQQFKDGAIYAVEHNSEVCIKRVFRGDGHLTLVSDNPSYRPITIREGEVVLVGRMAGWFFFGTSE